MQPGRRVLDIGCGLGDFTALAQQRGARPIGLDVAAPAIERARECRPELDFRVADADRALELEDASIDLIWASELLEHVLDTAALMSELRRVLVVGGDLLITTPFNGRVKGALSALRGFERGHDPLGPDLRFYTPRSLRHQLGDFGFADIEIEVAGGVPLLRETILAAARRARWLG